MPRPDNTNVELKVGTPPDEDFEPVHVWFEKCKAGYRLRAARGEHEAALLLIGFDLTIERYADVPEGLGFRVDAECYRLLFDDTGLAQPNQ